MLRSVFQPHRPDELLKFRQDGFEHVGRGGEHQPDDRSPARVVGILHQQVHLALHEFERFSLDLRNHAKNLRQPRRLRGTEFEAFGPETR